MPDADLSTLATDINFNIANQQVTDGELEQALTESLANGNNLLGVVAPPPSGWAQFMTNVYVNDTGDPPGPLNYEFNGQVQRLIWQTQAPFDWYQIALVATNIP
jgi:hypothetical protein